MFAVVQIGSSERRSPCITARMVRAREGCACVLRGSIVSAVVASVPCTNRRRVVRIEVLPYRWTDLLTERRSGTRGLRLYGEEPRRRRLEPWPQARSEAILRDTRCARSSG